MPHPVKLIRNIRIPMPDGVTLAADIHLPDVPNFRGPAIIEYTPYHKVNNSFYGPRATRYPYFASHGYAFVNVDIRGTGDSEGFNESPTSEAEVRDNVEVVRWCAKQAWCDGAVGMIGISYTAGVCYDAARQAPPELKAVILCQMCSDWYDGMACPGGTPRPFAYENYAPLMAAYNLAPPTPELVGEKWAEIWQQRLDGAVPWGLFYLNNMLDGPAWEQRVLRGHHDKVKAATFLIGGWCDWYPDDFLRTFSKLKCPKRVLIGPWTHNYPENGWPLPRINDRYECLRWFDKHLKGKDTDPARPVDREPQVTVFVRDFTKPAPLRREDAGYFRNEANWPVKAEGREFYLGRANTLASSPASPNESDFFVYRADVGIAAGRYVIGQMLPGWGMPDDQRLDEGLSLVYSSDVITESLEAFGVPHAKLFYEATTGVAFLSVKLCDVAPDGTSVLVSKAVLNLTHLKSHEKPEPLTSGKVYEIDLPLLATAYRFAPGHRIRVMISGADVLNAWPTPEPYTATIHRSPARPSRIVLPIVGTSTQPAPNFLPSDFPPLPPDQVPTPQYSVTRDLIQNTLTCSYTTKSGVGINRSSYVVNLHKPAEATVTSEFDFPFERPGSSILVKAQCVTRSDATAFHHTTDVSITVNGRPHWAKSWRASVKRLGC